MYRSFFDNNLDALLLANDKGDIFAANKAACKLFGKPEEVIVKQGREGVVDTSDLRLKNILERRKQEGLVRARIRLKRSDNTPFEAEITTTVIDFGKQKRTLICVRDITAEAENEKQLIDSQSQNEILISNLPGMVYRCLFDENWTFTYVSKGCQKLTGYTSHQLIDNNDVNYGKLIHKKYRKDIWKTWKRIVADKATFEGEYQIADKQGKSKWVWERGRPVFDDYGKLQYLEGYIEDITERKKNERELVKFTRAVEQNMSSIVLTDTKGQIEYVNNSFTDMCGYSRDEVIGRNMRILKSGLVSADVYKEMWGTILNGNTWRGELINKKKNGELFWVNKAISPIIDSRGKISNFVSVAENITERKKAEEELIEAKERAEEVDRLKTAFLANMSHELRTPLNAVIGFSELIDEHMSKEQILEFSRTINQSGNHLLEIVEQIFDVSLLETGNMPVDCADVDIIALLGNIATEVLKMFEKHNRKNLAFDVKMPNTQSYFVKTDRKRLKQILINLIDNAVKFTAKGTVQFGFKPQNQHVLFWVSDTGLGISDEKQRMIFQMFNQVEQAYTRNSGGIGIGLTVSQKLTQLLGGKMWVESKVGKGSTFYFTISEIHNT